MNKRYIAFAGALVLAAGILAALNRAAPSASYPADLRDAPNNDFSGLQSMHGSEVGGSAPAVSASAPVATAGPRGKGKWSTWYQIPGDFDYLGGTQNVNSGAKGAFKGYYRCNGFKQLPGSSAYYMSMEFGNDLGGNLGIATWTRGPSAERTITVAYVGLASFSQVDSSGREHAYKNPEASPLAMLNNITDDAQLCGNAFKNIAAHRDIIVKYIYKRDFESMKKLAAVAKFIPGAGGLYGEALEISCALQESNPGEAAAVTGCAISGVVLETVTHHLIKSELLKYLLGKSCSGALTAHTAMKGKGEAGEHELEAAELSFTGALKGRMKSLYYVDRTRQTEPIMVDLNFAYIEKEETIRHIFFQKGHF